MTEIVAGRIDYCFCPVGNSIELIRGGKLRSLAVSTPKRVQALADVPTTLELGFKNSDYDPWVGLLAPRGTARPIMERLAREIGTAMKEPGVAARLAPNGILPTDLTLDAFDAAIVKEIEINAEIAKAISLRPT
jgi:tripartite-type tricarboxylate transporter receptor subunit TctC